METANQKPMYDLTATELSFAVLYTKGSQEFPLIIRMRVIPEKDLLAYDYSTLRTFSTTKDGGVISGPPASESEVDLFDRFAAAATNPAGKSIPLELIAPVVKRAVIQNCYAAVTPGVKRADDDFDPAALVLNRIVINQTANQQDYELVHAMGEPSAADDLEFRRATSKVKAMPGTKRASFVSIEQFEVYPRMYRRLAQSVEGYGIAGGRLDCSSSDKAAWIDQIPYYHMKAVVRQLFGIVTSEQEGEE